MPITYVAHAAHAALLLDETGISRWVVPQPEVDPIALRAAHRSVGAQFVASLDPTVEGFLHPRPRLGAALLFTAMRDGRAALVRFGPLVQFDELPAPADVRSEEEAAALVASLFRDSLVPTRRQVPLVETGEAPELEAVTLAVTPVPAKAAAPIETAPVETAVASEGAVPTQRTTEEAPLPASPASANHRDTVVPPSPAATAAAAEAKPVPPAPASDSHVTGVFSRNEDSDAELLRVVAGLAAELAPVSSSYPTVDEQGRAHAPGSTTDLSAETSQFSYAVMGNASQRADSAWPQPIVSAQPRRIG